MSVATEHKDQQAEYEGSIQPSCMLCGDLFILETDMKCSVGPSVDEQHMPGMFWDDDFYYDGAEFVWLSILGY